MSQHTKPIELADFKLALTDLTDTNLLSLQKQLNNSISKLQESNEYLANEIKQVDGNEEDIKLYRETIDENKQVILNQVGRLEAIDAELVSRGMEKTNSIYV